jgi:single-strand DNA-binding protein
MVFCMITGNLGGDAVIRTTPGGKTVCGFTVASRGRTPNDAPTWVRCSLWGARGEKIATYLKKGGRVAVSGSLSTSEYEGKTRLELDVGEVELLGDGRPRETDVVPPPKGRAAAPSGRRTPPQKTFGDRDDEDIAF